MNNLTNYNFLLYSFTLFWRLLDCNKKAWKMLHTLKTPTENLILLWNEWKSHFKRHQNRLHILLVRRTSLNFSQFYSKGCSVTPLNVLLEDLTSADMRGRWWIVGSAWAGKSSETSTTTTNSSTGNIYLPLLKIFLALFHLHWDQ